MKTAYHNTPIGWLKLIANEDALLRVEFSKTSGKSQSNNILRQTIVQLDEYFAADRTEFTIPLTPIGTEFQQNIWQTLKAIPYGQTASYKEIAVKANNPKASRAVGNANNRNPIPVIIPCHRVIGTNGEMVGYAGGLRIKEQLLQLEGHM